MALRFFLNLLGSKRKAINIYFALKVKVTKYFLMVMFMFKVKYVDSITMLVRLDLNLIVSLFQHKCEVSETVSITTLDAITLVKSVKTISQVISSPLET